MIGSNSRSLSCFRHGEDGIPSVELPMTVDLEGGKARCSIDAESSIPQDNEPAESVTAAGLGADGVSRGPRLDVHTIVTA